MLPEAVQRCHGLQCPQVANKCKYNLSPLEISAPLYEAMLIGEKKNIYRTTPIFLIIIMHILPDYQAT